MLSIFAFATVALLGQQARPPQPKTATKAPAPAPKPANAYVDPVLCAACHQEIAATYEKTGMGRSFSKISAEHPVEPGPAKPFYHEPSDTYYAMVQHDGKTFQRRWQLDYDGKETNVEEKSADYVLGSGNHGRTYLHMTPRGGLQQLPLGWYAENGGSWNMLPGFDRRDYPGSERPIHYECMFCHNAYPQIPKANEEPGAEAVYQNPLPNGIDCQRCHGPGRNHIQTVGKAGVTQAEIRASIVNPARLSPDREMEVCMECHLETSSLRLPHAVQRVDKAPFSYNPAQPLENFELIFDREPGKNTRFEVAGGAYGLRKSQCYLKTQSGDPANALRCTTCHDPHNIPRGAEATAHYNGICRNCHAADFTRTVSAGQHTSNTDCISCHMPKRRTDDAIHIVMTDHFIQRNPPPSSLAMKPESYESDDTAYKGEVVPYWPAKLASTEANELDVAVAQVRDGSNLKEGIPRLEALLKKYQPPQSEYYLRLAEAWQMQKDAAHAEQYYNEALRHNPTSTVITLDLANAQIEWKEFPQAEATLRRALALTPNDPVAWGLLGQTLFQQGKFADAKPALEKAVSLDADLPEPHNYLAGMLVRQGDLAGAEREFRAAIDILPSNADWQSNLAGLIASRGDTTQARFLFERAIKLNPALISARINYARLLANLNQTAEATKQAQAAIDAEPNSPDAHELLGLLLAGGDPNGSIRELTRAVELDASFARAQYELGVALAQKGDRSGAIIHLRIAALGDDPQAKAAAAQVLQQLGN